MNFSQILALAIQAYFTRSTQFAITLGTRHFGVTISQGTTPGHMDFATLMAVVATIMAGQPGTFTVGVFTIVITPLTA